MLPTQPALDALLDAADERGLDSAELSAFDSALWGAANWLGAFEAYASLADRLRDEASGLVLWARMSEALQAQANAESRSAVAAKLWGHVADIEARQLRRKEEALWALRRAFEAEPSDRWLEGALALLDPRGAPELRQALLYARTQIGANSAIRAAAWAELGHSAVQRGAWTDAEELFDRALREDVDCRRAKDGKLALATLAESRAQRIAFLRTAATKASPGAEQAAALLRLGDALWELPNRDETIREQALAAWNESLSAHPLPAAIERLAAALEAEQDWLALRDLHAQVAESSAETAARFRSHRALARLAASGRAGKPEEELAHLEAAFELDGWDSEVLERLAVHYQAANRAADEAEVLERLRAHARSLEENERIFRRLATVRWKSLDDWHGAEPLYRRIRARYPDDAEAEAFFGAWWEREGDWPRLYAHLEASWSRAPEAERGRLAQRLASLADERLNQPLVAAEAWRRVLEVDPTAAHADARLQSILSASERWHALADHHQRRARWARAHDDEAVERTHLEALATLYEASGSPLFAPELAVGPRERLVALAPQDSQLRGQLADLYRALSRITELVHCLSEWIHLVGPSAERNNALQERAELLERLGRLEEAFDAWSELAKEPGAERAFRRVIELGGRLKQPHAVFEASLALAAMVSPDEAAPLWIRAAGLAEEALAEPARALALWEQLAAQLADPQSPHNGAALAARLRLTARLERWEDHAALLETHLARANSRRARIEVLQQLAPVVADRLGQPERAQGLFAELLQLSPFHEEARRRLVADAAESGEWAALRAQFEPTADWRGYLRALEEASRREEDELVAVELQLEIARVADTGLGDPGRAARALERIRELDPGHLHAARQLVPYYEARGAKARLLEVLGALAGGEPDPAIAAEAAEQAIAVASMQGDPKSALRFAAIAAVRGAEASREPNVSRLRQLSLAAGDVDSAVAALSEVAAALTKQGVPRQSTLLALGELLAEDPDRRTDARLRFEEVLESDPHCERALQALASLAFAAADWQGFAEALERRVEALGGQGSSRPYLLQLGETYESVLDDPDRAIATWQRLRALDPSDADATDGLLRLYESQERWREWSALAAAEAANDTVLPERRADLCARAALVHMQELGESSAALELAQRALALDPQHHDAIHALRVLAQQTPTATAAAEVWLAWAAAYGDNKDRADALQACLSAYEQAGQSSTEVARTARAQLAALLEQSPQGQEEAAHLYLALAQEQPADLAAWDNAERTTSSPEAARALALALEQTIQGTQETGSAIPPGLRAELLRRRATVLESSLGDLAQAAVTWAAVLQWCPKDQQALHTAARLYASTAQWEPWLALQWQRTELAPSHERAEIYLEMASVLERELHQPAEAAEVLEEALREGAPPAALTHLERAYRQTQNAMGLVDTLRRQAEHTSQAATLAALWSEIGELCLGPLDDPESASLSLIKALLLVPRHRPSLDLLLNLACRPVGLGLQASTRDQVFAVLDATLQDGGTPEERLRLDLARAESAGPAEKHDLFLRAAHHWSDWLRQPRRALEASLKALEAQPDSAAARELSHQLAVQTGDLPTYLDALRKLAPRASEPAQRELWSEVAQIAEQQGALVEAAEAWERAAGAAGDGETLWARARAVWQTAGAPERALQAAEREAEAANGQLRAEALRRAAELAIAGGQIDRAKAHLRAALAECPDPLERLQDLDALLTLAQTAPEPPEVRAAWLAESAEILVDASPEEASERWLKAADALTGPDARAMLQRAHQRLPERAPITLALARAEREQGRPLEAARLLRLLESAHAGQADPAHLAHARLQRAALLEEGGDAQGAAALYEQLSAEGPSEAGLEALLALERLAESQGRGSESASIIFAWRAAAQAQGELDMQVRAQLALLERVEAHASDANAWAQCAHWQIELGDETAALQSARRAYSLDPSSGPIFALFAQLASSSDPRALVEAALEIAANAAEAASVLAPAARWLQERADAPELAQELWAALAQVAPNHEEAFEAIESALRDAERWQDLAELLTQRERSTAGNARTAALYQLANVRLVELSDPGGAADAYRAILEEDPDEDGAAEMLEGILERTQQWAPLAALWRSQLSRHGDGEQRTHMLRRLARLLATHLQEASKAEEVAAELLTADPTDAAAHAVLEHLRSHGALSPEGRRWLQQTAETRRDWPLLLQILREDAAATDGETRIRLLERAADVAERRLGDFRLAYAVRKELAVADPSPQRLERAERMAEANQQWPDWAEFLQAAAEAMQGDARAALLLRAAGVFEQKLKGEAEAAALYQRIWTEHPHAAGALRALERLYAGLGRWADLLAALVDSAPRVVDPSERAARLLRAAEVAATELKEPTRAAALLEQALDAAPGHLEARRRLERIYIAEQRFDALHALYDTALQRAPESPDAVETAFKLAFLLSEKRDDLAGAHHWLAFALGREPGAKAALRLLEGVHAKLLAASRAPAASAQSRQEHTALAKQAAQLLVAQYDDASPWEQRLAALQTLADTAETDDELASALMEAGAVLAGPAQQPAAAFARYATALRVDPQRTWIIDTLEALCERAGTSAAQLVDLVEEVGVLSDPLRADFRLRAAQLAERRGLDARAMSLYAAAAGELADPTEALRGQAQTAERLGDASSQLAALRGLIPRLGSPTERAPAWARAGQLAESAGQPSDAIAAYLASLEDDPNQPRLVDRLESIYLAHQRFEDAAALLQKRLSWVTAKPRRLELLSRLASVYDRHLQRPEEAVLCYREIFEINNNSIYAIAGLERLAPKIGAYNLLVDVMERKRELLANPKDQLAVDFQVAQLYHRHLGEPERALDYYRMVVARDERHPGAIAALELLAQEPSLRVPVALILEDVYERGQQWEALAELWRRQLALTEDTDELADIAQRLVELLESRLGRPREALTVLVDLARRDPSSEVLQELSERAEASGAWDDVCSAVAQSLQELSPGPVHSALSLWEAQARERNLGDLEGAMRRYRELATLAADPTVRDRAQAALEHVLEQGERWPELYEVLAGLVDARDPARQRIMRLRLADLAEGPLEDLTAALQWLKEVLTADPTDREAQTRLERLAETDPDLRTEIIALLLPMYEAQGRFAPLARLYDLQVSSSRDPEARAEAALHSAHLLANRLEQPGRALDRWLLALAESPPLAAPHLEAIALAAARHGRLPDFADGLERAAAGLGSGRQAFELYRQAAEVWAAAGPNQTARAHQALRQAAETGGGNLPELDQIQAFLEAAGAWEAVSSVLAAKARLSLPGDSQAELWEGMARAAEARQDHTGAIEAYEQLQTLYPHRADILSKLETLYQRSGDDTRLAQLLEKRAYAERAAGRSGVPWLIRLARLREESFGDTDGALEALEAAVAEEPGHPEALRSLEHLCIETSRWDRLEELLERQIEQAPVAQRVDLLRRLATLAENELDDIDAAILAWERVCEASPSDTDALDELLRLLHRHGRWEQLVQAYDRKLAHTTSKSERTALALKKAEILAEHLSRPREAGPLALQVLAALPDQPQALLVLARVHEAEGDIAEARRILEALLERTTHTASRLQLHWRLGSMLSAAGRDSAAAEQHLASVVKADPAHREANERLRQLLEARGDLEGMVEVLKRQASWATTPAEQARRCRDIARLLAETLRRPDDALQWWSRAHELQPDDEPTAAKLIEALRAKGDTARLKTLLEWMLSRLEQRKAWSELPPYAHLLGRICETQRQPDEALRLYRLAFRHDATYLPNLLSLGRLLLGRGDVDQALGVYQAMQLQAHAAKDNTKVEIFHTLGRIYLQKGDNPRAKQYFQRVLSIDRHHQPTHEALRRL